MAEKKKLIKVPPLRKKGRSLVDLGPESLAAAVKYDQLAAELAPAELGQVPRSGRVKPARSPTKRKADQVPPAAEE